MDFSSLVLAPCQAAFGKPILFSPFISQPGVQPFMAGGIWTVRYTDVLLEDGSCLTTRLLTVDIQLNEIDPVSGAPWWPVTPVQGDHVGITADEQFEEPGIVAGQIVDCVVDDVRRDSGGAAKLILKQVI